MKQADEVYVRLRDRSTSFHDASQGKNVVSDRIEVMKRTALVSQAIHHNVLDIVPDAEAEAALNGAAPAPAKKKDKVAPEDAAPAPAKKAKKDKVADLTADDDEDEDA